MGTFIVIEGGEGCGKSTQAQILYERLLREGHSGLLLHEPGGTPVGDQIRRLLKSQRGEAQKPQPRGRQFSLSPMAELLLFSAARAELVNHVLSPALDRGHIVVCDRYTPSTIAYQGYGRGLPLDLVENVNLLATQSREPNLVILLDMEPEVALRRVEVQASLPFDPGTSSSPGRIDEEGLRRFEEEPLEFHQRVRRGYLELAKAGPDRWLVVDGSLPKEQAAEIIWQRVEPLLGS